MADAKRFIFTSSEIAEREQPFSHPWNPKSQLIGVQLGRALGLKRTGVNVARMPPGKESFVYHSHQHEEEWLYILSGRGIAEIDGEEFDIGPGAFGSASFEESFRSGPRIPDGWRKPRNGDCRFPRLGKRLVRNGEKSGCITPRTQSRSVR